MVHTQKLSLLGKKKRKWVFGSGGCQCSGGGERTRQPEGPSFAVVETKWKRSGRGTRPMVNCPNEVGTCTGWKA